MNLHNFLDVQFRHVQCTKFSLGCATHHEVRSAKTNKGFAYYFDKAGNAYIWCVLGANQGMLVLQKPYSKASPSRVASHGSSHWYLRLQHAAFKIQGKVIHDNLFVHRGVAMAFPEICGLPDLFRNQIDHINGDTHDNRACNLRWVTQSENMKARFAAKKAKICTMYNLFNQLNNQSLWKK